VGNAKLNDDDTFDCCDCVVVAADDRLVPDADADAVADVVVTGAIGPLISKSSTSRCSGAPRFADAGAVDAVVGGGTGLDRCFDDDDDDDDAAGVVAAVDTRAALAECGAVVVVVEGVGADFLDGVGRAFV
jgi:hypothetical protein